jgi:uncharacterized damage-inducible protein DinB
MTDTAPAGSTQSAPDREAIRADLEATRTGYHDLLASLSDEDWKKKSANPAWNVRQLMWHLAWGNGFIPDGVKSCKNEKGFNPPQAIADFGNTWWTRFGSRSATPKSVAEKYDETHGDIIATLDGVQDDEWSKGTKTFGEYHTVESMLRSAVSHFKEHQADILKGLRRV